MNGRDHAIIEQCSATPDRHGTVRLFPPLRVMLRADEPTHNSYPCVHWLATCTAWAVWSSRLHLSEKHRLRGQPHSSASTMRDWCYHRRPSLVIFFCVGPACSVLVWSNWVALSRPAICPRSNGSPCRDSTCNPRASETACNYRERNKTGEQQCFYSQLLGPTLFGDLARPLLHRHIGHTKPNLLPLLLL